jgi:hypothetical protein
MHIHTIQVRAKHEAAGKTKKVHVPYRDSVLTKLLAGSLGGNSRTCMVANWYVRASVSRLRESVEKVIHVLFRGPVSSTRVSLFFFGYAPFHFLPFYNLSLSLFPFNNNNLNGGNNTSGPAPSNTSETSSTLRFAARVKSVKNKPVVVTDPKDAKLKEMSEEIERLKSMIAEQKAAFEKASASQEARLAKEAKQEEEKRHAVVEKSIEKEVEEAIAVEKARLAAEQALEDRRIAKREAEEKARAEAEEAAALAAEAAALKAEEKAAEEAAREEERQQRLAEKEALAQQEAVDRAAIERAKAEEAAARAAEQAALANAAAEEKAAIKAEQELARKERALQLKLSEQAAKAAKIAAQDQAKKDRAAAKEAANQAKAAAKEERQRAKVAEAEARAAKKKQQALELEEEKKRARLAREEELKVKRMEAEEKARQHAEEEEKKRLAREEAERATAAKAAAEKAAARAKAAEDAKAKLGEGGGNMRMLGGADKHRSQSMAMAAAASFAEHQRLAEVAKAGVTTEVLDALWEHGNEAGGDGQGGGNSGGGDGGTGLISAKLFDSAKEQLDQAKAEHEAKLAVLERARLEEVAALKRDAEEARKAAKQQELEAKQEVLWLAQAVEKAKKTMAAAEKDAKEKAKSAAREAQIAQAEAVKEAAQAAARAAREMERAALEAKAKGAPPPPPPPAPLPPPPPQNMAPSVVVVTQTEELAEAERLLKELETNLAQKVQEVANQKRDRRAAAQAAILGALRKVTGQSYNIVRHSWHLLPTYSEHVGPSLYSVATGLRGAKEVTAVGLELVTEDCALYVKRQMAWLAHQVSATAARAAKSGRKRLMTAAFYGSILSLNSQVASAERRAVQLERKTKTEETVVVEQARVAEQARADLAVAEADLAVRGCKRCY